ncbi:hypothetical protein NL676_011531 [Syzygium grande]|nr:hypothetical protein NL676_011531 [Syzygium grande]
MAVPSFELERPWLSQALKPDPTSKLAAAMANSYNEHSERFGRQWVATNECQKSFWPSDCKIEDDEQ